MPQPRKKNKIPGPVAGPRIRRDEQMTAQYTLDLTMMLYAEWRSSSLRTYVAYMFPCALHPFVSGEARTPDFYTLTAFTECVDRFENNADSGLTKLGDVISRTSGQMPASLKSSLSRATRSLQVRLLPSIFGFSSLLAITDPIDVVQSGQLLQGLPTAIHWNVDVSSNLRIQQGTKF